MVAGLETYVGNQILLAGDHADASADNATATATATPTVTAGAKGRLILLGVTAHFSAAVAAIKDITLTYTRPGAGSTNTITISWDFTAGAYTLAFPAPLTCDRGTAASAALAASGAGGTVGRVTLWYAQT